MSRPTLAERSLAERGPTSAGTLNDSSPVLAQEHGGAHAEHLDALGLDAAAVLDLSVNLNPFGPCGAVRDAIARAPLNRYPSPRADRARAALAEHVSVDPARVVLGNGAAELMWALARTGLCPSTSVLLVEPTFSEMRAAAVSVGARLSTLRTRAEDDFVLDLGALDKAVRTEAPALVYLCAPSNPAGRMTDLDALSRLADRHPQTLFVCDVSFLSLSEHAEAVALSTLSDRVVWLRSLTKDHALAGLRVGFALAPPALVDELERRRPPWSINSLAQAALLACTGDDALEHVRRSRVHLLDERRSLSTSLARLGLRVHPSEAIYVLADLGPDRSARELTARLLLRHRVLVRDATSFGLPHHLRIAARSADATERLVHALALELQRDGDTTAPLPAQPASRPAGDRADSSHKAVTP